MKAKKTSPLLIFTIAQTLEKMQDYASAMIHYQDLMQSFPGSIHESEAREKRKHYFGSYQEEDIYSFKIKIETHLNKGVEKIEEKNFHEGIVHLLRAHNLHGKHYLTSFYLGYAYYALYQTNPKMVDYLDRAIRFYLDAISSRQSPKAYNNLACIFAGQEDEILAHVYFRRALETATKPMEMPGLVKAIQENLDFFSNERKTRKLQFLRELMQ